MALLPSLLCCLSVPSVILRRFGPLSYWNSVHVQQKII